jgi:hypothetical protein
MSTLTLTTHAAVRMAQRGIMPKDSELIVLIGTEVSDGYLVREKDYQELEHALKRWLQGFRRVVGKRLVVSSGHIVTTCRRFATVLAGGNARVPGWPHRGLDFQRQ